MGGSNKKSTEQLEKEVAELIVESGQCEQDFFMDFNDYRALNKRSNTPGSILNNCDISQKTDLHSAFLLWQSITNKKKSTSRSQGLRRLRRCRRHI